jgi:hypothetical protein
MPFDATPTNQPNESRIIDAALRILGPNGEHWMKGSGVDAKYCMLHARISLTIGRGPEETKQNFASSSYSRDP